MIVSLLIFTVYTISALLMLYYTLKLSTLYAPPKPPPFTREEIKTTPSRWMDTFSGRASNLGGAARDVARTTINEVARSMEALGVEAGWMRERRSIPYVVWSVLRLMPDLAKAVGRRKALHLSLELLRFYFESRRILRLYHLVDVNSSARQKVDRAITYIVRFREKLIGTISHINTDAG